MKTIIESKGLLNGIKVAAVALIFQAVISTTPATATTLAATDAPVTQQLG